MSQRKYASRRRTQPRVKKGTIIDETYDRKDEDEEEERDTINIKSTITKVETFSPSEKRKLPSPSVESPSRSPIVIKSPLRGITSSPKPDSFKAQPSPQPSPRRTSPPREIRSPIKRSPSISTKSTPPREPTPSPKNPSPRPPSPRAAVPNIDNLRSSYSKDKEENGKSIKEEKEKGKKEEKFYVKNTPSPRLPSPRDELPKITGNVKDFKPKNTLKNLTAESYDSFTIPPGSEAVLQRNKKDSSIAKIESDSESDEESILPKIKILPINSPVLSKSQKRENRDINPNPRPKKREQSPRYNVPEPVSSVPFASTNDPHSRNHDRSVSFQENGTMPDQYDSRRGRYDNSFYSSVNDNSRPYIKRSEMTMYPDNSVPSRSFQESTNDNFLPSVGDKLTRNGIQYVYHQNGWREHREEKKHRRVQEESYIDEDEPEKEVIPEPVEYFMKDIPNYNLLTQDQQVYIRTRFNIKFDMLRETWPQYMIPHPPMNMSLSQVHIIYNHYVKHIYSRENAQTYTLYIIIAWLIMEIICVKLLKLPAGGFTKFRMNRMGKYRMLLIQLGEKYNQGGSGSGWPVEVKILVISLVEMVVFIAVRWLLGFLDENATESTTNFITDLIDKQFGITGIRGNTNTNIPEPSIPKNNQNNGNSGKEPINIPVPPDEQNDISEITGYIPAISNFLNLEKDPRRDASTNTKSGKNNNAGEKSAAMRARARARAKKRDITSPRDILPNFPTFNDYDVPPFDE